MPWMPGIAKLVERKNQGILVLETKRNVEVDSDAGWWATQTRPVFWKNSPRTNRAVMERQREQRAQRCESTTPVVSHRYIIVVELVGDGEVCDEVPGYFVVTHKT